MARARKYTAKPAESSNRVARVMPFVSELLDGDLMPLIKRVVEKRMELYLREVDAYTAKPIDLAAIREVINWHRTQATTIRESENYIEGVADRFAERHDNAADKLTRAIGDKP